MRRVLHVALLGMLPAFAGCLVRTHTVQRTHLADGVLSATPDELISSVNARFNQIQTMNARVDLVASTGGVHSGTVKEYPSLTGYIILRKPADMRVILQVPVIGSRALDMVSDGTNFKLLITEPKSRAIEGSEEVTEPSKNGLENLRPGVFLNSVLVQGLQSGQIASFTSDVRVIEPVNKHQEPTEEPDYDFEILAQPEGRMAKAIRVIHIGRSNLLPYQQDVYDAAGHVVTRVMYSDYQKFGDIQFPTKIVIKRPLDEYTLSLTITKVTFNETLENDQFELKIPDNVPVQHVK